MGIKINTLEDKGKKEKDTFFIGLIIVGVILALVVGNLINFTLRVIMIVLTFVLKNFIIILIGIIILAIGIRWFRKK